MNRNFLLPLWLALALLIVGCSALSAPAESATTASPVELTVAAAADLQFAFTDLAALFEQETDYKVTLVFGSTGQLAQQIENGAPYDLFAAANIAFVEELAAQGFVLPETQALYARGRIVLAVNREVGVAATELSDLLLPDIQRIAIANPEHAPYGRAAQQALESVGIWEELQTKLIFGENVRQTLQFIQSGDAQAGIVALSVANVPEIAWTLIDEELHKPLDQALAVVARSPHPDAASAFAEFINSPIGRPIMRRYGFVLPGEDAAFPTPNNP